MARPTSKDELLSLSNENFSKLINLIETLPEEKQEMNFLFEGRDRNIRDVLAHLHEWHLMMLKWYETGMNGEKPITPAKGYTWKTLPALNLVIWEKYQDLNLETVQKKLIESHKQIENLINKHSNEELFVKGYYPWTKTTSLGSYFISSTSSHYDWAIKKVRKHVKLSKT
ncbi:MAG: ClbS/DfsB family four-helix bundle protein [Sebaldella sp.]|nr:ClbS/DfsB family four-helix bundle protein [Sebaldella sp.]